MSDFVDRGTHEGTRRRNRALVLRELQRDGGISRAQIAIKTGMTNSVVSRITREMVDIGLVRELGLFRENDGPGRSSIKLELSRGAAYVVGIALGAFDRTVRLVDSRGEVLAREVLTLPPSGEPGASLTLVAAATNALVVTSGIKRNRLLGCGVAISGIADVAAGRLLRSVNLGWTDVAVGAELTRQLHMPVWMETLPNVLNLGEMRAGATKGKLNTAFITAGLGVGASFIVDGNVLRSSKNAAGQIGHMHASNATHVCTCGRVGCLDTVASGRAILMRLKGINAHEVVMKRHALDAKRLADAIGREKTGDQRAIRVFREAGTALGRALDAVIATIAPEAILLGGALAQVGSYFAGVRDALRPAMHEDVPMMVSRMEVDEAAAWLALDKFLFSDNFDLQKLRIS